MDQSFSTLGAGAGYDLGNHQRFVTISIFIKKNALNFCYSLICITFFGKNSNL